MSGYADISDGMRRFSADGDIGREIYKRMVMNVLCGNTDDHYRNHAFLLDEDSRYRISPVFDVTPTLQASATRRLFLDLGKAGCGRDATLMAAFQGGESLGLYRDEAAAIANDLAEMVENSWRGALEARGASARDIAMLENAFSEASNRIRFPELTDEPAYHG
jgi:serine/threonine-protein kinase HipA